MSEPHPDYYRIGDDLKKLGEWVNAMAGDASLPHQIEPVEPNQFRFRDQTVRLPTYKEIVSAINRLRTR